MYRRVIFLLFLYLDLVSNYWSRDNIQSNTYPDRPNAKILPLIETFSIYGDFRGHVLCLILLFRICSVFSLTGILLFITGADIVNEAENKLRLFLKELFLFFLHIFRLFCLIYVITFFVLLIWLGREMLVDFFHLFSCRVKLECNDPCTPLGSYPVDQLDKAIDTDIPQRVEVLRTFIVPPWCFFDSITNAT